MRAAGQIACLRGHSSIHTGFHPVLTGLGYHLTDQAGTDFLAVSQQCLSESYILSAYQTSRSLRQQDPGMLAQALLSPWESGSCLVMVMTGRQQCRRGWCHLGSVRGKRKRRNTGAETQSRQGVNFSFSFKLWRSKTVSVHARQALPLSYIPSPR